MERLWNYCAFCGKRIEMGEMCYGLPNGDSFCADCCVAENEGAAVSDGEEEHGVWVRVHKTDPISGYRCSKCRRMVGFDLTPYCPNCGARMDGGNAEG